MLGMTSWTNTRNVFGGTRYIWMRNEPLGVKGPPMVGEEVRKEVGKVEN